MTAIPEEFNLQSYDFDLPESQIAQDPAERRGASRLLVLDRASGDLRDCMFADIAELLPRTRCWSSTTPRSSPPASSAQGVGRQGGISPPHAPVPDRARNRPRRHEHGRGPRPAQGLQGPQAGRAPAIPTGWSSWRWRRANSAAAATGCARGELADHFRSRGTSPCPYIRREDTREDRDRYQTVYSREDSFRLRGRAHGRSALHAADHGRPGRPRHPHGRSHPLRGLRHLQPRALRRHPRHARRIRRGAGGDRRGHRQGQGRRPSRGGRGYDHDPHPGIHGHASSERSAPSGDGPTSSSARATASRWWTSLSPTSTCPAHP